MMFQASSKNDKTVENEVVLVAGTKYHGTSCRAEPESKKTYYYYGAGTECAGEDQRKISVLFLVFQESYLSPFISKLRRDAS